MNNTNILLEHQLKNVQFTKKVLPIFDNIEWENIKDAYDDFNKTEQAANINIIGDSLKDSIIGKIMVKFNNKLKKQKISDNVVNQLTEKKQMSVEDEVNVHITQLQELLRDGSQKENHKKNANSMITSVIDRDENIKMACMNSLSDIYKSYLPSELFSLGLLNECLEYAFGEKEIINNMFGIVNSDNDKVFSRSINTLSHGSNVVFLQKTLDALNAPPPPNTSEAGLFNYYYGAVLEIPREMKRRNVTLSGDDTMLFNKIYFSLLQDFFIIYIKVVYFFLNPNV